MSDFLTPEEREQAINFIRNKYVVENAIVDKRESKGGRTTYYMVGVGYEPDLVWQYIDEYELAGWHPSKQDSTRFDIRLRDPNIVIEIRNKLLQKQQANAELKKRNIPNPEPQKQPEEPVQEDFLNQKSKKISWYKLA